jgi:hypothetical protein
MNSLISLNTIRSVVTFCALSYFAFLPNAQAVVPPPDGFYPGFNTAEGEKALFSLTTGAANTAVGWFSLFSNTDGSFNTATGAGALLFNTADENTAFGAAALLSNSIGSNNTAVGASALLSNTAGAGNTAIGENALASNTTGNNNVAIGSQALLGSTGGNEKIALGRFAGIGVGDASNVICIGAPGLHASNSCFIGNIFTTDLPGGNAVFINSDGRLGLITSSQRFKKGIKPMNRASEALFSLKPVTFRYKKEIDPLGIPQFGLVAEEVAKVHPDLVIRDQEGKPYTVRYEQINAMLLNEFLKEHRKGEEQDLAISQLKSALAQQQKRFESKLAQQEQQIAELMAHLQRLAAEIELNKGESQARRS